MPQTNAINVKVFPADEAVEEPLTFDDVHYVSFVNDETYGIPALISDQRVKEDGLPLRVLYINVENCAAIHAERTA